MWYSRLIAGPLATIEFLVLLAADVVGIPPVNEAARQLAADALVTNTLNTFGLDPNSVSGTLASDVNEMFGDVASVDDMRPGSPFLNQLNDIPEATLPAARYAIYGSEGFYSFIRLFDSFKEQQEDGNPMEQGDIVELYFDAAAFWLANATFHNFLAYQYKELAEGESFGSFDYVRYMDYRMMNLRAANQWFLGFSNLIVLMPGEWKVNITKSLELSDLTIPLDLDLVDADDGLLSKSTQAPAFFDTFGDNITRRLEADGANHVEQTVHPSVKGRLIEIFDNSDVLIDRVTGGGDGGGGDGGSGGGGDDEPCLADPQGNCIEF